MKRYSLLCFSHLTAEMLHLHEIRILLVGWVLSGKSYAGNIILNGSHFSPGKVTEKAKGEKGKVYGRKLTVVDTPGWWKFLPTRYIPEQVQLEVERGIVLCGKYPHAIVLCLPVDVSFHEEERQKIKKTLEAYLGKDVWRHIIILFTWGQLLKDTTIEEAIESEGKAMKWLIQKCGNRYHVFGESGHSNEVEDLLEKIEDMVAGNCVFCPLRVPPQTKMETQVTRHKADKDDAGTDDVVAILYMEWLRRDEKTIEEVRKKWDIAMKEHKQKSIDGRFDCEFANDEFTLKPFHKYLNYFK